MWSSLQQMGDLQTEMYQNAGNEDKTRSMMLCQISKWIRKSAAGVNLQIAHPFFFLAQAVEVQSNWG